MVNSIKSTSARYGHIKRRLLRGEPLSRDLLELALDLVGDGNTGDDLMDGIANKLISNKPLGDYELHLMVDVFLLHARLACASGERTKSVGQRDGSRSTAVTPDTGSRPRNYYDE